MPFRPKRRIAFLIKERRKNMQRTKLRRLAVSAIFIALATVLSLIKLWTNPWGGSVTLLSMVPIVMLSVLYGVPWGLFSAFVYSLVQIGVDIAGMMGWGMDARMWIGAIVFDYILAYTSIGLAGAFRKANSLGVCLGSVMAFVLRFISHFISGCVFFDIWMPETFSNPALYSIVYNGTYMLPELILTLVAAIILFKTSTVKRIIDMVNK